MGGSYNVVVEDLASASATFSKEASAFQSIMGNACLATPDGGDASVDKTLGVVVDAIALLHDQIATAIGDHATKLKAAHDNYQRQEEDVQKLCQDLTNDAKIS
jgi:hypothetical protein